ncbi:MAG: SDR family oxidoreductase [Oligosphaeraceae bacterium]|nr:SDR family oxidoreductase [Oligosphaeraceae bacterium]
MKFNHRTAVITGAAGGVGRALAQKLAAENVSLALTDLSLPALQELAESLSARGIKAKAYIMDVSASRSVQAAAGQILDDFGQVDILVNNAGVWVHENGRNAPFLETTEENWQRIIDINLNGTYRVTQAFLPQMVTAQYGRIINLGSIAGEVGLPGFSDYSAAKAGVIMLTKCLAMEMAKHHITVNCVSPGMVSSQDGSTSPTPGNWIGRTGKRSEIADLIAFLAADDAAYITGVDYTIDGGRILGPRGAVV